jgi:hypothetical protein
MSDYDGETKDGLPHGFGRKAFEVDGMYEGQWVLGKRHGQGELTHKSGNWVAGTWQDDKAHGAINYFFSNGDTVTGKFEHGLPVGQVTVTLAADGVSRSFPWPKCKAVYVTSHAQVALYNARRFGAICLYCLEFEPSSC